MTALTQRQFICGVASGAVHGRRASCNGVHSARARRLRRICGRRWKAAGRVDPLDNRRAHVGCRGIEHPL